MLAFLFSSVGFGTCAMVPLLSLYVAVKLGTYNSSNVVSATERESSTLAREFFWRNNKKTRLLAHLFFY